MRWWEAVTNKDLVSSVKYARPLLMHISRGNLEHVHGGSSLAWARMYIGRVAGLLEAIWLVQNYIATAECFLVGL